MAHLGKDVKGLTAENLKIPLVKDCQNKLPYTNNNNNHLNKILPGLYNKQDEADQYFSILKCYHNIIE